MTDGSIGEGVEPSMLLTLALALVAMLFLFAVLLQVRLRLERSTRRVAVLQREASRSSETLSGSTA